MRYRTDRIRAYPGNGFKGPGRRLVNAINEELEGVNVVADDYTSASLLPGVKSSLQNRAGWELRS